VTEAVLPQLSLTPAEVPELPAKARNALIAYLLRWGHDDEAGRCLHQLLATHPHLVSVYDNLARVYLRSDQARRALEMMHRRHGLRISNSSRILEAEAHLAAGDLAAAQAIAGELTAEHPEMISVWGLQTDLCLAAGDLEGASAALQRRESLRPETAATAQGLARLWQARGDAKKALLWARTALSRTERDGYEPAPALLDLLESLYRETGQAAQAQATARRREARRRQEMEALREQVGPTLPTPEPARRPASQPAQPPQPAPSPLPEPPPVAAAERTRLEEALHRHFAHEAFRPGQAEAIAAVLRGESVLTVMPTGAGKSLCYQLASLLLPGTTLVISPLIALMKDQLDGLPSSVARQATTLNSTLDGGELAARLARAAAGGYKMLYAAPERLRQRPFLHALEQAGVSLLVVDEAHCVSLWGHDFRPDYLFIAKAWHELGQPPLLAMTATATPRVRDDVQAALSRMRLVALDVQRPNLHLEARHFSNNGEKSAALVALCRKMEGSGIVYATSRQRCEDLAKLLRRNNVSAIHYHAGLADRAAAQDQFMSGQVRVVVATVAFGMGIDKADVRFIIHYNPPKALENYYQEAGRAGRDGLPSRCILFHAPYDKANLTRWSRQDALHVEFLRQVYAAVQRRLGEAEVGLVTVGDLERDLAADPTHVRVAVHFLETAGLLWRGFDLPRTASLCLSRAPGEGKAPELARFVEAARLRPGQTVSRNLIGLAADAGEEAGLAELLDPRTIEARLLAWQEGGWLEYRGIGRDMLLALPEPSPDARQRVAAMLADYRAGQDGRIAEMMGYAGTDQCRHGYISAYFGGRAIDRCQACDNCTQTKGAPRPAQAVPRKKPRRTITTAPGGAAATGSTGIILKSLVTLPFPLGRTGLARALQGAGTSPVDKDSFPLFGALSDWTQKAIRAFVDELEELGLLLSYKEKGYRLLHLTEDGQRWLEAPPEIQAATIPTPPPPAETDPEDYDQDLFERLRAWRLETARAIEKPPFVIFHDSTLKAIATARPGDPQALLAVKGVGPRKLEQYGPAVLAIVAGRDPDPPAHDSSK
jgi:ATP-dependent DNA helicase RecQ